MFDKISGTKNGLI